MTTPPADQVPDVVAHGYDVVRDTMWWRFANGEVRLIDAVARPNGNYVPNPTPAMAYRYGRTP